jgi:lysozyme family protein
MDIRPLGEQMNRDQAIGLMIRLEGGYSNNPADPGGATKYGITQRTLDAVRSKIALQLPTSVFNLTEDQAYVIYRAVDWDVIQGDALPSTLAPLVLNAAVNMGEPEAVKLLQECLHGVPTTGHCGAETLAAVKAWRSPYLPEQTLAEEYAAHVGVRYASLYAREGQFELGWIRRLLRVYTLALGLP